MVIVLHRDTMVKKDFVINTITLPVYWNSEMSAATQKR
uniref:Uncharacterized protein n=1 Tax=Anguilla anguilla TaxID=7936 RepID=A0A0E9TIE5_ANGAN